MIYQIAKQNGPRILKGFYILDILASVDMQEVTLLHKVVPNLIFGPTYHRSSTTYKPVSPKT
ncbi:MAG TPA: hypothetical protein DCE26_00005 [Dehalococcoidia bacterium]|nr:hypothetical protein [Dehalococcoidia bacterium]